MQKQAEYMSEGLTATNLAANAAKDSADAALLNAKAAINSERAWVDIDLVKEPLGQPYLFKATNHGRTPAYNVALVMDCRCFGDQPMKEVPDITLTSRTPFNRLIAAGESVVVLQFEMETELGSVQWQLVRGGKRHLVFQGSLEYQAVIVDEHVAADKLPPKPHQATFCFRYEFVIHDFERMPQHTQYT